MSEETFDEWAILELLGHRRVAGRVREATIAGAGFLRVDEPGGRTQFVSPSAVYALHPTTEEIAAAMATQWHTPPVQTYDLRAALEHSATEFEGPL